MTLSSSEVQESVTLISLGNGKTISVRALKVMLPDVETALFFAKLYKLDIHALSSLLREVFNLTVLKALTAGDHSTELQDYLIDTVPTAVYEQAKPTVVERPPHAEILPELWEAAEVQVATSIQKVADSLAGTLAVMPGKQGRMVFGHLSKLNKQRPTIGTYAASINHARVQENLVVLDVSGSMSEGTVRTLINDVVALSWKANAHLAIVSDDTFHWEPGSYNVDDVLRQAQYGGTHYETLMPLLHRDWGTVVTIADYDSSWLVASRVKADARGSIQTVLDLSLVNRPTYLAEVLGQLANEVKPLLIGSTGYVLT